MLLRHLQIILLGVYYLIKPHQAKAINIIRKASRIADRSTELFI
jgi:hypothetical protein